MQEGNATLANAPSPKRRSTGSDRLETLEKARGQLAKLLQVRIAEKHRELDVLRTELAAIGGHPDARKKQACSACGKTGHTKRTCPEAAA